MEDDAARRGAGHRRRREEAAATEATFDGRDSDRGHGRGRRDRDEDSGDRAPRVIEQRAKREAEPEIDPNLPEAEQFRLKLERLRQKFEKGR